MNNERFYFLLTEYIDGHLDEDLELEIKSELEKRGEDVNDLEGLKTLSGTMLEWQIPEPSERVKDNFYSLLAREQQKQAAKEKRFSVQTISERINPKIWLPRLAYAAVFLLLGYIVGQGFTPNREYREDIQAMSLEIQQVREVMMLTLINDPMASERLKAVGTSQYLNNPDDKIITALLNTLNEDPNENVRLAAVDALLQFSGKSEVRQGLIESISIQDSPMMQIALADGMAAINGKEAVPYFRELLQRENLNSTAKTKIEETIQKLS
nr:HEAT repeat domain-containing protein [Bacteroidota bacterium]